MHTGVTDNTQRRAATALFMVLLVVASVAATAHTIDDLTPYHLAAGDHFNIELGGIALAGSDTVVARLTHVGSSTVTNQTAESFAGSTVGVRLPDPFTAGQYDVEVLVNGTANTGADGSIWVRELPFSMIREASGQLPSNPTDSEADFKDSDFGDFDNDGFLDIIEAVSRGGSGPDNNDQLFVNQLGKAVRDCPGTSFYCNETASQYEQSPAGIAANSRTYDADLVDVDMDGDLDLVRIDAQGAALVRLLINDGTGDFDDETLAQMPALGDLQSAVGRAAEVDVGDADGDGRPDLLLCSWSGTQNGLLLNRLNTSGRFEMANDAPCDPASAGAHALCKIRDKVNRSCAFGQFDGAGGIDIVLPTFDTAGGDMVLLHTGNTGGIPQYSLNPNWIVSSGGGTPGGAGNTDLKVADLDGDGDDDVVITESEGSPYERRILWNDGGTRLVELDTSRFPESGRDYDADFADLDRDGDLDLLFGSRGSGFGPVMINKGGQNQNMMFEATGSGFWLARSPGGVVPAPATVDFGLSVSPGDFDLDGDHDLLTGGFSRMGLWTSDLYQQPGQARDWVFILDKTRSMVDSSRDFFEPAKNVLATFSTQRRDQDAVGFVTYDYTGSDTSNPNAADDANKAQRVVEVGVESFATLANTIRGTALGTCSGHCTAIGWAIKTGNDMAADAPVPDPDLPREQVLVLATDGEQNQAPHPDTIIPDLPAHVRLYTIALGTDTDDRMLSAMATNGGKFHFAGRSDDYTSVQSALREVDNDIEGHATGKQPLLPVETLIWSQGLFNVLVESPIVLRRQKASEFRSLAGGSTSVASAVVVSEGQRWHFLVDPSDREVRFTMSWRNTDRTVGMRLIDPRGVALDPATDFRVSERRWTRAISTTVLDPLSGLWRIERVGGGNLGPAKATGMASSLLTVVGEAEHPRFFLDENLVIIATIDDDGNPVPGARGEARCLSPTKVETVVSAQADASGKLVFNCGPAAEPGSWKVDVTVFGSPSRPFVRNWQEAIFVAIPTDEELDLRTAELTLDKSTLAAGGADRATATLRIRQRDGSPMPGERVVFLVRGGRTDGAVTDHGDGSYSQELVAGRLAGRGEVRARVGLEMLPNAAEFEIAAGPADLGNSAVEVMVGPLALCTNQLGAYAVQVVALDSGGNPVVGAAVEIDQVDGHEVNWLGAVEDLGGGTYERRFEVPRRPGQVRFSATIEGAAMANQPVLDVFEADSPEGRQMGCPSGPVPKDSSARGCWWVFIVVLVILIFILLVWWLLKKVTS